MGIFELFGIIVLIALVAAGATWLMRRPSAGVPQFFITLVWIVAAVVVIVLTLHAFGLVIPDPQVPRVR